MMRDRGIRTTTKSAEAIVGVIGADPPGRARPPSRSAASAATRSTPLYNGNQGRPVEHDRTPDGYVSTSIASRSSKVRRRYCPAKARPAAPINYVTKTPHTGAIVNEGL